MRVLEYSGPRAGTTVRADAALMLLALRNVERAARWTISELSQVSDADHDTDDLLAQFHAYLPGLVDARDALEHFDEYAVGKGRLQRTNPVPYDFDLLIDEGKPVLVVGPLRIPVERARDACRWLVISLLARMPVDRDDAAEARAKALLEEVLARDEDE